MKINFPVSDRGGTEAEWVEVAKQVIAGKFNKADKSTLNSIEIGLQNQKHRTCIQAMEALSALRR